MLRAFVGTFLGTFLGNNPSWLGFGVGFGVGVYLEQSYNLPDVEQSVLELWDRALELERNYRKGGS